MGRRIDEFRLVSFQSQSHAATITRIGADTPRSFSRREDTIDSRLQLHRVIDVALSGNQASTGMLAEKDSERICRLIPDRRFCPLSHFRVTTFISRGGPSTRHAFRHGHRIRALGRVLPCCFQQVRSASTKRPGAPASVPTCQCTIHLVCAHSRIRFLAIVCEHMTLGEHRI